MDGAAYRRRCIAAAFALALSPVIGVARAAGADELPPHMDVIVGHPPTTQAGVAERNVLALDIAMFGYYDEALRSFQQNLLAQHPVILALFSGSGGDLILYRPGQAPVHAEQVPVVYQVLKSVAHSTMALFELAAPHLDNPADQSWRTFMLVDRTEQKAALDTLGDVNMDPVWRATLRVVLQNNIAFMDAALAKGTIGYAELNAFAKRQKPYLAKSVTWAAGVQVQHWMSVVADWKQTLGKDWDKTYGVSNSIYVARQNNILFSVLAQHFGQDALNTRLMLFETTDFNTTPEAMLTGLTRVVADRSVGAEFFGNYYLMDYELMGGDGRTAIAAEDRKLGIAPFLPPLAPFGSHEWPFKITPGPGPGSIEQLP